MLVKDLLKVSTSNTLFEINVGSNKYVGNANNVPFSLWEIEVIKIEANTKGIVIGCKAEK